MSEIPHPFIEESMLLFFMQPEEETAKIHFIHFNHTNPVLQRDSEAAFNVEIKGFNISKELSKFSL